MQNILYEEPSAWLFILITIIMGGSAAWQTGKAVAGTWKPISQMVFYILLLGCAVRFFHFALFDGTLLSLHFYIVDTAILALAAYVGWRFERSRQMIRQYGWLYQAAGPGIWRRKS